MLVLTTVIFFMNATFVDLDAKLTLTQTSSEIAESSETAIWPSQLLLSDESDVSVSLCGSDGFQANEVWENISTESDLETCLLSVAEAFASPEKMQDWFVARGFTTNLYDSFGRWPTDRPVNLFANCTLGSTCPLQLSGIGYALATMQKRSLSIEIQYDKKHILQEIKFFVNWE